jgi:hypothetical protein
VDNSLRIIRRVPPETAAAGITRYRCETSTQIQEHSMPLERVGHPV